MTVQELIEILEKVENKNLEVIVQSTDPTDWTYNNDVEKVKPYRGKVAKAYPLGNRKYSARHFTVGEDGVVSVWNSSFTYLEDTREGETQPRRETAMPHAHVYPDNTIQILKLILYYITKIMKHKSLFHIKTQEDSNNIQV